MIIISSEVSSWFLMRMMWFFSFCMASEFWKLTEKGSLDQVVNLF